MFMQRILSILMFKYVRSTRDIANENAETINSFVGPLINDAESLGSGAKDEISHLGEDAAHGDRKALDQLVNSNILPSHEADKIKEKTPEEVQNAYNEPHEHLEHYELDKLSEDEKSPEYSIEEEEDNPDYSVEEVPEYSVEEVPDHSVEEVPDHSVEGEQPQTTLQSPSPSPSPLESSQDKKNNELKEKTKRDNHDKEQKSRDEQTKDSQSVSKEPTEQGEVNDLSVYPEPAEDIPHKKDVYIEEPASKKEKEEDKKKFDELERMKIQQETWEAMGDGVMEKALKKGYSEEVAQAMKDYVQHMARQKEYLLKKGYPESEAEEIVNKLYNNMANTMPMQTSRMINDVTNFKQKRMMATTHLNSSDLMYMHPNSLLEAFNMSKQMEEEQKQKLNELSNRITKALEEDKKRDKKIHENRTQATLLMHEADELETQMMVNTGADRDGKPSGVNGDPDMLKMAEERASAYQDMLEKYKMKYGKNPTFEEIMIINQKLQDIKQLNQLRVGDYFSKLERDKALAQEKSMISEREQEMLSKAKEERKMIGMSSGKYSMDSDVLNNIQREDSRLRKQEEKVVERKVQDHMDAMKILSMKNVRNHGGTEEEAGRAAEMTAQAEAQQLEEQAEKNLKMAEDMIGDRANSEEEKKMMALHMAKAHMKPFHQDIGDSLDQVLAGLDRKKQDEKRNKADSASENGVVQFVPDNQKKISLENAQMEIPLSPRFFEPPETEKEQEGLKKAEEMRKAVRNTVTQKKLPQTGLPVIKLDEDKYLNVGENFKQVKIENGKAYMKPEAYAKALEEGRDVSGFRREINDDGEQQYVYEISDMTMALPDAGKSQGLMLENGSEKVDLSGANGLEIEKGELRGVDFATFGARKFKPTLNSEASSRFGKQEQISPEEARDFEKRMEKFQSMSAASIEMMGSIENNKSTLRETPPFGVVRTVETADVAEELSDAQKGLYKRGKKSVDQEAEFDAQQSHPYGLTFEDFQNTVSEQLMAREKEERMSNGSHGSKLTNEDSSYEAESSGEEMDLGMDSTGTKFSESLMTSYNPFTGKLNEDINRITHNTQRRAARIEELRMSEDANYSKIFNRMLDRSGEFSQSMGMTMDEYVNGFAKITPTEMEEMSAFFESILNNPLDNLQATKGFANTGWFKKLNENFGPENVGQVFNNLGSVTASVMGLPDPAKSKVLAVLARPSTDDQDSGSSTHSDNRKVVEEIQSEDGLRIHMDQDNNQFKVNEDMKNAFDVKEGNSRNRKFIEEKNLQKIEQDSMNKQDDKQHESSDKKDEIQNRNPQYGNQQNGNPQYGNPQYGNPQMNNPQNRNPQMNNPQYGNPQNRKQQYGNPQMNNQQYGNPQMNNPQNRIQQYGNQNGSQYGFNNQGHQHLNSNINHPMNMHGSHGNNQRRGFNPPQLMRTGHSLYADHGHGHGHDILYDFDPNKMVAHGHPILA